MVDPDLEDNGDTEINENAYSEPEDGKEKTCDREGGYHEGPTPDTPDNFRIECGFHHPAAVCSIPPLEVEEESDDEKVYLEYCRSEPEL